MRRFEGKTVVVTGAAKGQGRAHAVAFAQEGARLVISDICEQIPCATRMGTKQELEATQEMVEDYGPCRTVLADVRSMTEMETVAEVAVNEFGSLDILIANAGIAAFATFAEMTDDMWFDLIDVNLGGVANSIRAAVPHMRASGAGRIVATSSEVGREGGPGNANYAASKWGVIGLVKSVAEELAPTGITVNAIAPMSVSTDMCHNAETYALFRPDLDSPSADDVSGAFGGLNPMGVPWLELDDVTNAVRFLASDEARYITGVILDIAGGWNCRHAA